MREIILMSDARVAAVPVEECGEPLVDVSGVLLVDERKNKDSDSGAELLLRRGVLDRLLKAEALLPDGLRLLFVEGYRPPVLQRRYFEGYGDVLRAANPDWSADRIRTAASRYVSPPEIAPHTAGAAVDLTLADTDGRELDLGATGRWRPVRPLPCTGRRRPIVDSVLGTNPRKRPHQLGQRTASRGVPPARGRWPRT